jgi:hypothetical protein
VFRPLLLLVWFGHWSLVLLLGCQDWLARWGLVSDVSGCPQPFFCLVNISLSIKARFTTVKK